MIKNERQSQILEIIKSTKYASVSKLAKLTYSSCPTIRRDLDYLSLNGYLTRTHGGAMDLAPSMIPPLDYRKEVAKEQKKLIGSKAASFIQDGMVIFIDESVTASFIINKLSEFKNLTIITNGLLATNLLSELKLDFLCTGGEISGDCFIGSYAEKFIRGFNADICFFSTASIFKDGTIAENGKYESSLKKTMLDYSKRKIYLADDTKFNAHAIYNIASIENIDYMITTITEENFEQHADKIVIVPKNSSV